jgi:hypothetical protein
MWNQQTQSFALDRRSEGNDEYEQHTIMEERQKRRREGDNMRWNDRNGIKIWEDGMIWLYTCMNDDSAVVSIIIKVILASPINVPATKISNDWRIILYGAVHIMVVALIIYEVNNARDVSAIRNFI